MRSVGVIGVIEVGMGANGSLSHRGSHFGLAGVHFADVAGFFAQAPSAGANRCLDPPCRRPHEGYPAYSSHPIAVAAVLDLFNPARLFVHGRLFEAHDGLFARMVEKTSRRAFQPPFANCKIVRATGQKYQGQSQGSSST
jgi:hypothetical protein